MVSVRFAPSPTGFLHIGGARTAIFNWLFARKHSGKFFLRIEDTDVQRSTEEMTQAILEGLSWLGLSWDAEPIKQSDRLAVYREVAIRLLESGKAYRSFNSAEEVDVVRKQVTAQNRDFRYREEFPILLPDEQERLISEGRPYAIRFAVPAGATEFEDQVYGKVSVDHATIDDFIILRSDGLPTYHLAVVVDDHEMGITHVIRGADHLSNTPKQIMLYEALGWHQPVFAHLPLILGPDKTRLSKRHGATSIGEYQRKGYLPEAVLNYLALLGWNPGDEREVFTLDELISSFDISGISKSNAIFDEKKLEWMNGQYLSTLPAERIEPAVRAAFVEAGIVSLEELNREQSYLHGVVELLKGRVKTVPEFVKYGTYFFRDPESFDEDARRKQWSDPEVANCLNLLAERLEALADFSAGAIESGLRGLSEELGIAATKLIHPGRLAVTGFGVSPGLFETFAILGKERVVRRLRLAAREIASTV